MPFQGHSLAGITPQYKAFPQQCTASPSAPQQSIGRYGRMRKDHLEKYPRQIGL